MSITTTLAACSTTPANNGPDGAVDPPSTLDDAIRSALSFIAQLRDTKAALGANADITSLAGLTTALSIAQGGTGAVSASAAADALGAFRRGTILGVVSQAAGVPTGALMEYGSTVNGEYWRYAGGQQICSAILAAASNVNNAIGSIFTTGVIIWTFPASFIATPSTSVCESAVVGGCWGSLGSSATSTTATSFQIKSPVSVAVTPNAALIAVGRWF